MSQKSDEAKLAARPHSHSAGQGRAARVAEDEDTSGRPRHIHRDFEGELRMLNEALLGMGGRIEQMIGQAARALFAHDVQLAQAVAEADRAVNDAEMQIDSMCLKILARRQPMGSDLRFVTRAMKMVTDIERVGDLAVNVAKRARKLAELGATEATVHPAIERMAELVREMIGEALDAFVERDTELAHKVIARDDEVDALHQQVYSETLERMRSGSASFEYGVHVIEAAAFLERMGDHACNVAEQVVFMVRGEDIRHPG